MPKVLVKIGKEMTSNKWNILLGNKTHNFSIECHDGFEPTMPFPGAALEEKEIKSLIIFLKQSLMERGYHEQSDVE